MQPFANSVAAKSSDSAGNSNQYISTKYPLLHSILYRSNRHSLRVRSNCCPAPVDGNVGRVENVVDREPRERDYSVAAGERFCEGLLKDLSPLFSALSALTAFPNWAWIFRPKW
jgi:hypothetical protein